MMANLGARVQDRIMSMDVGPEGSIVTGGWNKTWKLWEPADAAGGG